MTTVVWAAAVNAAEDMMTEGTNSTLLGPPALSSNDFLQLIQLCIDYDQINDAQWLLNSYQERRDLSRAVVLGRLRLAKLAIDHGQLTLAADMLTATADVKHEYTADRLTQSARLYARQGNAHGAALALKQLLQAQPNDPLAQHNLAASLSRSGQIDQAIQEFALLSKTASNSSLRELANLNIAELRLRQGNMAAAVSALETITDRSVYQAQALKMHGLIAQRQGRPMAALQIWKKVIEQYPNEAGGYWFHYALQQERLGDRMGALTTYHRALVVLEGQHKLLGQLVLLNNPDEILAKMTVVPELLDAVFRDDGLLQQRQRYREAMSSSRDYQKSANAINELKNRITGEENAAILRRLDDKLKLRQLQGQSQQSMQQQQIVGQIRGLIHRHADLVRQMADRAEFEIVRLQDEASRHPPRITP